jgi:GNAT superfamily N-acetyltransferase
MPIRVEYRPATLTFDVFHRLDAECFPHEPTDARAFASIVVQDFWAAWDGETLVGFAQVSRRPDVSWLSRIGTSGAHRRRGVAFALMQSALEHCREIGLPDTILYVQTDNPAAIRLYERFGFRAVESAYHFLLHDPRERLESEPAGEIRAVPISDASEASWPHFQREWAAIAQMHRPPDTYVLLFLQGAADTVGYCRLDPNFPGCFPFVLDRPSVDLMAALRSISGYLLPDKPILKLTTWDPAVADACSKAGLELSYELLKMLRRCDP